jgi:chromosome segregation ATPase
MTVDALKEKLAEATKNRERIALRCHNSRLALDEAEIALGRAEGEARKDAADAVFEDRESPGPALRKKLDALGAAITGRRDELTAAQAALAKAQGVVDKLRGELDVRRHENFIARVTPALRALEESERAHIAAAVAVEMIRAECGESPAGLSAVAYPSPRAGWENSMDNLAERNARATHTNAALALHLIRERPSAARAV